MKQIKLDQRRAIFDYLSTRYKVGEIAKLLNYHRSTIQREIKRNSKKVGTGWQRNYKSKCKNKKTCIIDDTNCNKLCSSYKDNICPRLKKVPFVCNGCVHISECNKIRKIRYLPENAHDRHKRRNRESQIGIRTTTQKLKQIDSILKHGMSNGRSIYNIVQDNKGIITQSEKTIYSWIDSGVLSMRNHNLTNGKYTGKPVIRLQRVLDREYRRGRTHDIFLKYSSEFPIWEMDTVQGKMGESMILTLIERESSLFLCFKIASGKSSEVASVFKYLRHTLGDEEFKNNFGAILTDNGSEFMDPKALEFSETGELLTRIFYCDPYCSSQKGKIENIHKIVRYYFPKGQSLKSVTQLKLNMAVNHINSYSRKKFNNKKPYDVYKHLYGTSLLNKLGLKSIKTNDLILNAKLFK